MTHSDKILGVTIDAGQANRQYSQYKVEHTGSSLDQLVTVTEEVEQELDDGSTELVTQEVTLGESEQTLQDYFTGPIQIDTETSETYLNDGGGDVAYSHRVRVADDATRDEVVSELETEVDEYEVFDFTLTDAQKHIIEREQAVNDSDVDSVLELKSTMLDRELVDDETRLTIAQTIEQMKTTDPELGGALDQVYEVFTGETTTETTERL